LDCRGSRWRGPDRSPGLDGRDSDGAQEGRGEHHDARLGQRRLPADRTYKTTAPLVIPPGVTLVGDFANEMSSYSDIAAGTVIQPDPAFARGSAVANAVILILGQVAGRYASVSEEQKITGIFVDGSRLPARNTADGISVVGDARRIHLARIMVAHNNGNGFSAVADSRGNVPDALRLQRVMTRFCGQAGFVIFRVSDCTFTDCLAENCTGNGWTITNLSNGKLIGCRSEHNNIGYSLTNTNEGTGSGGGTLIGCSTDRSQQHGIQITTTNGTGVPVILSGCAFRRDGRNNNAGGGGFAGINVSGYPGVVQIAGCTVFPGVDDDGSGTSSPQTGLRVASTAALQATVIVSGSYIQAAAAHIADDGLGTVQLDRSTVLATGPTGTPSLTSPVSRYSRAAGATSPPSGSSARLRSSRATRSRGRRISSGEPERPRTPGRRHCRSGSGSGA